MKPGCFTLIVPVILFVSIIFITGCPANIGKCTYGEKPAAYGTVKIKSIDKVSINSRAHLKVSVTGFFTRDFFFAENEFKDCFSSRGYKAGTELEGNINSGGPCPPVFHIKVCDGEKTDE